MVEYSEALGEPYLRCSVKRVFLKKFRNIHRKTPVLKSLFNKVAGLRCGFYNFICANFALWFYMYHINSNNNSISFSVRRSFIKCFWRDECLQSGADYMRETGSLFIHRRVPKTSHFWKYFSHYMKETFTWSIHELKATQK